MDTRKLERPINPEEKANIFSKIFFLWTKSIFQQGLKYPPMAVDELCRPLPEDASKFLGDLLENKWMKELKNAKLSGRKPKLLYAVINAFGPGYGQLAVIHGISEIVLRLLQPILLGQLLSFFSPSSKISLDEVLIYGAFMVGNIFLSSLLGNHYLKQTFQYGMKVRVACSSVIYRKSLKINKTALGDTASGQVVNLLSNDVSRFDIVTVFLHFMWSAPLSMIFIIYYMWVKAGPISLVGVIAILLVVPLQSYTGKLASKFRLQTAYKTDERIRLMDEIICGIQVIKMYAWEKPFSERISASRAKELERLKKSSYIRGLYMTFNLFTTRFSIFCTMMALSLTGGSLSAEKIFVYSAYFGMLSLNMSGMYVRGFAEIAESLVSLGRLTKFLLLEEISDGTDEVKLHTKENELKVTENSGEVSLQSATARWLPDSQDTTLQNISINIKKGSLTVIAGPVGSGKSSLLQGLLGELKFSEGKISISGVMSYCSQEPWVFASSVRQNITFGLPYDKTRYVEVVRVCALNQDFSQFPEGDKTIIGDRGSSLSGGQRARINLARALYKDADIYLLDDPLSAVDSHVAQHLFRECICGFLKNKTRILVTHQLQYLKKADYIVLLDSGRVKLQGTCDSLIESNFEGPEFEESKRDEEKKNEVDDNITLMKKVLSQKSVKTNSLNRTSKAIEMADSVESLAQIEPQPLEEINTDLNVSFVTYFLSGASKCGLFILFSFFVLTQASASLCDFWMSVWTSQHLFLHGLSVTPLNDSDKLNETNFSDFNETVTKAVPTEGVFATLSTETCQIVYSVLITSLFVIALARSVIFYNICMKCSQKLHDLMFVKICQTYMSFFHTNPSGRILNRFSKDLGSIDERLPKALLDSFQNIMVGVGAIVVTLTVNYMYLVPILLVLILGGFTRYVFVKTSIALKKIEGVTRSPVFNHLNATLQGITTIRAYRAEEILKEEFDFHQDLHSAVMSLFNGASSAFGFVIDFLCLILVAFVIFLLISVQTSMYVDIQVLKLKITPSPQLEVSDLGGGEAGLAITQILTMTGLVQWGMRQSAEISSQLISVERVIEYTRIDSEKNLEVAPKEKEMMEILNSWPDEASIEFKNVFLYYDSNEYPAIKNLSMKINPGEKVGVVGRTGAGKTSLIAALFRLAKLEGNIIIGGIDTSLVSLQRLRRSISIIPQEPVLFTGSIRKNLDPFEEYPDAKLWTALEEVELKDVLTNGLESIVLEGGNNFSVGQKQLLCLARAILRNNKILLLDEATANVDPHTDSLIQKTIRNKFATCTVFTIAHRLNTIMDCDKVLVMEGGIMVEFDKPYNLLQIKNGYFSKMVQKTGPEMAEQLYTIAEKHKS